MICLPVVEDNVEEAIKTAKKYLEIADIVEFRVDMLKEVSEEDIAEFAKYPSIITVRPEWEGGYWRGSDEERLNLIKKAIECNAKFVDIELREEKNREIVKFRDEIGSKTKIIISYHDFEKTPSKEVLDDIVKKALSIGDIAKFATMANNKEDVLNILEVINKYSGKIIGIGMGENGKLTRILGVYFGSILTFASYKGKSSAPGQVDIETLKEIWKLMNLK
ncbi:type I 3-dehydroquinate dehydratase [Methanocaldococcus fervens]|uniref:3-dehydroquinate dehydratase n=1 Tax=Methanocaldococcus fervens (strain DSM 4213 / JCM 15782 / AG86) TaxID=573064 RepID=C7P8F6_METFA|nr:type I 3-dehydroquinate dehydratase [Methanocaldococcus fervens]ACV24838.1 3-dehydroquinate dehydratase, type I [Methanocaldococcus fervens AG86]